MTVTIRRAAPGDEAALAAVAAVTFPLACPPHTTDEAKAAFIATVLSEERFAEYLADDARRLLMAEDARPEPAIGYTMVNLGEPADADVRGAIRIRPTTELSKCYVLPGHQGAGVAGQLMAASLRVAAGGRSAGDVAGRQRGEQPCPAVLRQARLRAGRRQAIPGRRPATRTTG